MKIRLPRRAALPGFAALTLAGAAHALTFAPDPLPAWSLAPVQVLMLAVLARLALHASPRVAMLRGWWFGTVHFTLGLYWLYVSLHDYGDLAAPLSAAGVLALSAFLALFFGVACALARWLLPAPAHTPWRAALVWGASWALLEWLRATVLTGFPWLNIGYAHVDSPIAGWAPFLGVHGMALIAACLAAALSQLWPLHALVHKSARRALAAAGLALLLAFAGWPLGMIIWSHPEDGPLNVRLVQGNIEQSQKFDPTLMMQGIERHLQLAIQPPQPGTPAPDLIILPETVLPVFQDQLDPSIWRAWLTVARYRNAAIVMGVPLRTESLDGEPRYTNSAVGFDAETPVMQLARGTTPRRYDKHHLVPWGEYVPPGFHWFVNMLNIPLGDFDNGTTRQAPFEIAGQRLALNICYEDLFGPELLPALQPDDDEPGATVLVNLSNLGWFGDTWALRQHLQIGRLRTLETARPLLTDTNTGLTAAIDARGRVLASLPAHQAGVLAVSVQGMSGFTPYDRYGDLAAMLVIGIVLIMGAARAWFPRAKS